MSFKYKPGDPTLQASEGILKMDGVKTLQISNPRVFKILSERAVGRGFKDLNEAVSFITGGDDFEVVYIVLKKYNLSDLIKGIGTILKAGPGKTQGWYNRSWTKTVVLAGNPEKLKDKIDFAYATSNLALTYPVFKSSKTAKKLTNLLFPLSTSPINLINYKNLDKEADLDIKFKNNLTISLGKFVVQLAHILAEVGIEKQRNIKKVQIRLMSDLALDDAGANAYVRIDGGLTELKQFTHVATAEIK